ncbi:hypothetical protein BFP77_04150 [Maribacter sp. 4U21]|jgi:hypothetical protein|uniref:hypothetical protein n=1 Tax=Maribacter sp. 4U21 TaxID=1889779 RepID=UPI000C147620|nr:hypothetical protein [Maribacter sp. 4U21]PIB30450.1 hypothetical protein BFP77_04150 [Maribacter sp. 4U21]
MYTNLEEVEYDLKRLSLEREIALEEIKGLKQDVKEDLSPYSWMSTVMSAVKKYGILYLIRKIIR